MPSAASGAPAVVLMIIIVLFMLEGVGIMIFDGTTITSIITSAWSPPIPPTPANCAWYDLGCQASNIGAVIWYPISYIGGIVTYAVNATAQVIATVAVVAFGSNLALTFFNALLIIALAADIIELLMP